MNWLSREDLEDREIRELFRAARRSRDARRRRTEPDDALRTSFQRDRDRIIHSKTFRRLQHKTQVLAAYEGDHYRTRLTHSIEVSQMSRAAARALGLNADLAEAIALAHDLGHPPFGHVGEEALHQLMQDDGGFRHNAQGLRIVDVLEDPYGYGDGLNLTFDTRISLLKGTVPAGFPLSADIPRPRPEPPLEATLVDHCDKIAYLCHDLDDGLRAGAFEIEELGSISIWRRAGDARPDAGRASTISALIAGLIHDLVQTSTRSWNRSPAEPPRVRHSDVAIVESQELLAFLRERFYRSRRVLRVMEHGSDRIRRAFERFETDPDQLPEAARSRIDEHGLRRVVCDHVAGMTDRYLLQETSAAD